MYVMLRSFRLQKSPELVKVQDMRRRQEQAGMKERGACLLHRHQTERVGTSEESTHEQKDSIYVESPPGVE
jgi:hypothetical protein